MTLITGFFRDSGKIPIALGGITFQLDAPISDGTSFYTTKARDFAIVNGQLPIVSGTTRGVEIPETQTKNVTYKVTTYETVSTTVYYFLDGTFYDGTTHLHTDGLYYTGSVHGTESVRVDRVDRTNKVEIESFNTIVPNILTIDYAGLMPTQIATDKLPTTIAQLAEILINTPQYRQQIKATPNPLGNFTPNIFYKEDDWVSFNGSSYVYINKVSTRGTYPPNPTYWMLWAERGATGTGTAGNSSAYDSAGWNNQADAPSRGAVRNVIELLARKTETALLAPITNAELVAPTRSANPAVGDRTRALATTQWVGNEFAPLNSPTLTGNPAVPLQPTSDRSNRPASTQWVENFWNSILTSNRPVFVVRKTTNQTLNNGNNVLTFNTSEEIDSANSFTPSTATFTVPTGGAGWYEFSFGAGFDRTGGTVMTVTAELVVSGTSTVERLWQVLSGTSSFVFGSGVSRPISLPDAATAQLRFAVSSDGGVACNTYAGSNITFFSGKRLLV